MDELKSLVIDKTLSLIKNEIENKGIKQYPLEDIIGLSRGSINNWEKRLNGVSTEAIVKIAKYFVVSADYILGLIDEPKPYDR